MLATFRFRNYRSFKEEAELSLVASRADKSLLSSLITPASKTRHRLVAAAAIYGANAAGKTNVLRAFAFMAQAVGASQSVWPPDSGVPTEPFRGTRDAECSFEAELFLDGVRYRYGFTATSEAFVDEWLYSYPASRERMLFNRRTKNGKVTVDFGRFFGGDSRYLDSIKSRVRKNSLFVSAATQDNHDLCSKVYESFANVDRTSLFSDWYTRNVNFTCAITGMNDTWRPLLVSALQTSDPSIKDVIIEPIAGRSWDDAAKLSSNPFFESEEARYKIQFVLGHKDESFTIPFKQQSEGVKKLFGLFGGVLIALSKRTILLIDELESSIHPHVARMIVDVFQDQSVNRIGSQLIFTTHDTNLLDQTLLRRDQIWFVEKEKLCSHLYSLLEFRPRKDENLERGYLRGRYGAIPIANLPPGWADRELLRSPSTQVS